MLVVPTVSVQTFRLQKIDELQDFFWLEIESWSRLYKKYHRPVNIGDVHELRNRRSYDRRWTFRRTGNWCWARNRLGPCGSHCAGRRVWCYATKHEAIRVLANIKLYVVHSHISKSLEDNWGYTKDIGCISMRLKGTAQLSASLYGWLVLPSLTKRHKTSW